MTNRLRKTLSWWFILQIVLPFTAPLQTLSLCDLLGTKAPHSATSSPESTTTPTISDASSATAFVSVLAPAALGAATGVVVSRDLAERALFASAFRLPPSPQLQHSVLRL